MSKLLLSIVILGLIAQSLALPTIPRHLKLWPVRIVGGEPANPGELPFQLSLLYRGGFICGASILSADLIVTAAHCAEIGGAGDFEIVAGDHDRTSSDGREQKRRVSRLVIHEDYDEWLLVNDIALMNLADPLDLNEFVATIALPKEEQLASGDAVVSGWGLTSEGGSESPILMKVTVPIITDDECKLAYGEEEIVESMICAGFKEGGKDSCQGDSGGPLTASDTGELYLAGIVSGGIGCALPGFPGVYTEVSHFISWIEANSS